MKGLVFDTENRIQLKDFGEPLLDNLQNCLLYTSDAADD